MATKRRSSAKRPASQVPARIIRKYTGAEMGRLFADWVLKFTSANEEVKGGLAILRDRARDLERNNDHVRRYLAMVEQNTVGRGFQLVLNPTRPTSVDPAKVKAAFSAWAARSNVAGISSWPDDQRLVARTTARDGDMLVRILRGDGHPDGIALQYLESDYLDANQNEDRAGGGRIVMGVEVDDLGRVTNFHLSDRHPGDRGGQGVGRRQTYSAADIIHVTRPERPQQVRGVTWLASSIPTLRHLQGYIEAEVVASRAAACKMGFYKIPPGEDFSPDAEEGEKPLSDAAPGVFERMPTGWDFVKYDPTHPNANSAAFLKTFLRQIAGGLNVAYNNFANDLDGVSYSSIRSGTIEEREAWIVTQEWFAYRFLHRVWSAWLPHAATLGIAGLTAGDVPAFESADRWVGRTWPWVDPEKDLEAARKEVELGLTAPSELAAQRGKDYGAVQDQISRDNETRKGKGLSPVPGAEVDDPGQG